MDTEAHCRLKELIDPEEEGWKFECFMLINQIRSRGVL